MTRDFAPPSSAGDLAAPMPPRLSASALGMLEDGCPRAFALRYKQGRYWPAADGPGGPPDRPDEPEAEDQARLGNAFHLLVQQHALGLDVAHELAGLAVELPGLRATWAGFLASEHAAPPAGARVWTEQELRFQAAGVPVSVRYDRLIHHAGQWTILDWKTGHPQDAKLAASWQARLYPYALVEAGRHLVDGAVIAPEAVRVVFWDVKRGRPIPVAHDAARHAAIGEALRVRAEQAARPFDATLEDDPAFPRKRAMCGKCQFDRLCNRPFQALPPPPPARAPVFVVRGLAGSRAVMPPAPVDSGPEGAEH